MSSENEPRWLAPIFFALVVLFIIPVWVVEYIPTADGPAHVYNSWLIKELARGEGGHLSQAFQIDWRPHPNWLGHAVMAVLMMVVAPVVAEKLLFSLIIALFLGATWMLCGAMDIRSRAYAFIAFQLAYHQLLQTGFYNFSLSVGLYLLILATWWKRRDRPDAQTIAIVALLIVVCYFAHPMSTVLALGSLGVLWLLTLRGRPFVAHARHLIALLPVIPLLIWFVQHHGAEAVAEKWSARRLYNYIVQTEVLVTFTTSQMTFGKWLLAIYALLAIATLIKRQTLHAFGILTLILLTLYVWSPAAFAGGQLVRERLVLYIYLLPLAWFSPRLPKSVRIAVAGVFIAAAVAKGVYTIERFRHYGAEVTRYVRSYRAIEPNTTVLPLLFTRETAGMFTGVIGHASGYVSVEKRLVDLDNYEAATGYFPIRYSPTFPAPDLFAIEARPGGIDIRMYQSRAEYVFTWMMPDRAPVVAGLTKHYRLVSSDQRGKLYRRSVASQFGPAERLSTILLPIAGTPRSAAPAAGRFWRVQQTMRNGANRTVRVGLSACAELADCEFDLAPGQTLPLSTAPGDAPYIRVHARQADAGALTFSTVVQRVEGDRVLSAVTIPAVRVEDFRAGRLVLRDVTLSRAARVNLRLWTAGGSRAVRIRAGRAKTTIVTDAQGFFTHGDLGSLLGRGTTTVECEPIDDDVAAWGFITITDNATEAVTIRLP
jgi:hypothetical protein